MAAPVRGCGTRKEGGIYVCVPLSADGLPIECFLVCSPQKPDIPVAPQGMTPMLEKKTNTYHMIDHVGSEHYPNVADFVEEARRFGISRRIPRKPELLRLLGPGSRLLLMHSRARFENTWYYDGKHEDMLGVARDALPDWTCPHVKAAMALSLMTTTGMADPGVQRHLALAHDQGDIDKLPPKEDGSPADHACLGACWADVQGGGVPQEQYRRNKFTVYRQMPSFTYLAECAPDSYTRQYSGGIFMSVPISHLEVIDGTGVDEAMEVAQQSGLTVDVCDE